MANATPTTVTVTLDPNATSLQSDIIGPATSRVAGVMTAAQAAKLDGISPADLDTLAGAYDSGSSSADQTINLAAAKGGPVVFKSSIPSFGTMLLVETSASAEILRIVDGGFNVIGVLAAGAFIHLDPAFGSPVMGSQTPGSYMSYTADGVGGTWGGTGVTPQADGVDSFLHFTLNDVDEMALSKYGVTLTSTKAFGANPANGAPFPVAFVAGKLFTTEVGGALTISANAIAPTDGIHSVGAGLIKTITVPLSGNFRGSIVLRPTAAFTYDNTGNILVAGGGGTAIVARDMIATYDGTKWAMSY